MMRTLVIILLLSIVVAIGTLFINIYMVSYVKNSIITREAAADFDADCIIVLGAGVWDNGRPSHMLEDRIKEGIALYELGAAPKIIMSGDHGRIAYDEVNVMKSYALQCGVPAEDIFMDHAGFSTYESIVRAKEIFGANRVIIVTQKFHITRATYIAERKGMEAVGVPSDPRVYATIKYSEMREVFARVKDFFTTIFWPNPTYLGERISLDGSGNVTNDFS